MGSEAVSLLARMPGAKVICVGDVMLDRYIYGEASRISPEAPVPVVHVKRKTLIPGGVGNVVKNLVEMGICPSAVSVVGNDRNADYLTGFLQDAGLTLIRDESRPTIVKTRIVAGIQQVVRFDEEVLSPLSDVTADKLLDAVEKGMAAAGAAGAVAVSDYGKGVMTKRLTQALIRMAAARGWPVAIDPKGYDYSKYAGADLVKPNRKELGEAVGGVITDDAEVADAGRSLMKKYGIKNILVTLSDKGMMLLREEDEGAKPVPLPSKAREVFDVTGAGDTVLAGMAASMAIGADLALGARLATLAAGVVVGKVGTAVAHIHEIERAAQEEERAS